MVSGEEGSGATGLPSNMWPLPALFLAVAQGWRKGHELDGHACKDMRPCASIYTATEMLQKIHVIKAHVLVCVINVKYPSLTLLTVHLILKAELIYASVCWRLMPLAWFESTLSVIIIICMFKMCCRSGRSLSRTWVVFSEGWDPGSNLQQAGADHGMAGKSHLCLCEATGVEFSRNAGNPWPHFWEANESLSQQLISLF